MGNTRDFNPSLSHRLNTFQLRSHPDPSSAETSSTLVYEMRKWMKDLIFFFTLFCSHKKGRKKVRPKMTTAIFGCALIEP